jgi:fumarylacetoacetase
MDSNSWIPVPPDSDFTVDNLPFGIFRTQYTKPRVGVAIGEHILDMAAIARLELFKEFRFPESVFRTDSLNAYIRLGKNVHRQVRKYLITLLSDQESPLKAHAERVLVSMSEASLMMPIEVGNYTDFYSSLEHATNVGSLYRPDSPLMPNWKHLPVAYHGRASSIVASGTPIYRPFGQMLPPDGDNPVFGPTHSLDFELEVACIIGKETRLGDRLSIEQAEDYIFGLVLFNDWSARDIQRWEYQPLGPFQGKSFASSISPWVVTLEVLEPFRTEGPQQDVPVLDYLKRTGPQAFDIELEAGLIAEDGEENTLCRTNFKHLYWSMPQQLAHHTVNGCNLCIGDLMASGTISGMEPGSQGSLLELTRNGTQPLSLKDGKSRTFIEDGDTIVMRGSCQKNGTRIGFGEVRTQVLPAKR